MLQAARPARRSLADKAYDADTLRNGLRQHGTSSSACSVASRTGDASLLDTIGTPQTISPPSLLSPPSPSGSN